MMFTFVRRTNYAKIKIKEVLKKEMWLPSSVTYSLQHIWSIFKVIIFFTNIKCWKSVCMADLYLWPYTDKPPLHRLNK